MAGETGMDERWEGDLVTHQERTEKASRQGDRRGALWAIAHSVAAAADALEAGVAQRLDEINRDLQALTITIPFRGVIEIAPIPPDATPGGWTTGVVVDAGTYRIVRIDDERPEGETS